MLVSEGRIESAWPVHGGVLVVDGVAYFAAGRSSHLDGGIAVYAVDAATGTVLRAQKIVAEDRPSQKTGGAHGALSDLLVLNGTSASMRQLQFNLVVPSDAPPAGPPRQKLRVFATGGFLDDTWFNRIFWGVDGRGLGQMVVTDGTAVYGIRAYARPGDVNAHFKPGDRGYLLFAHNLRQPRSRDTATRTKGKRGKAALADRWTVRIPVRAQSLVLAEDVLFAAGTPDTVDPDDPWAAMDGRLGGTMWAVSTEDGGRLAEYRFDAPPVYDGMAAADGRLYLSTQNGQVRCWRAE
jgi:outer membrane protein assembly factor BamB